MNAINRIVQFPLGDGAAAVPWYRAAACVTDPSDGNAAHGKVNGDDALYFSSMADRIV